MYSIIINHINIDVKILLFEIVIGGYAFSGAAIYLNRDTVGSLYASIDRYLYYIV